MEASQVKTPSESEVTMTEVVFPNDTNPLGILRGGKILDWMDTASAVCAQTHANKIAVTVAIDMVTFRQPVRLGDIVTLKAKITRAFSSSMEIHVQVMARRIPGAGEFISNEAYYTFVALDENARPSGVPQLLPVTAEEQEQYKEALKRYDRHRASGKKE